MSEARQRVMETNRSLRLIKTELENLLEKGVLTDTAFDSIHALLPAEASLSGPAARSNNPTPAPSSTGLPTPPPRNNTANATPHPAPPSYAQSTASPPALPHRNNPPAPPPPAAPEKPVLTHARALYRYAASDARDCSFERDDRLAVYEYMNADWWMGRNVRTGQEGIFPRSYVVAVAAEEKRAGGPPAPVQAPGWGQQQQHQQYQQPQYQQPQYPGAGAGGYPMAPVPVQGYPAAPPPGQPQQQQPQEEESKVGKHGKNIGKKLGNAAIFGAGATIGSNIVNSIF